MNKILLQLKEQHEDAEDVWFFVTDRYRILFFNKIAYDNSLAFHGKELSPGDSILDYARHTDNRVDEKLITCLGKACAGQTVKHEESIQYGSIRVSTIATYMPVYEDNNLLGISITVQIIPLN